MIKVVFTGAIGFNSAEYFVDTLNYKAAEDTAKEALKRDFADYRERFSGQMLLAGIEPLKVKNENLF